LLGAWLVENYYSRHFGIQGVGFPILQFKATAKLGELLETRVSPSFGPGGGAGAERRSS
jgi:hypothetical protein